MPSEEAKRCHEGCGHAAFVIGARSLPQFGSNTAPATQFEVLTAWEELRTARGAPAQVAAVGPRRWPQPTGCAHRPTLACRWCPMRCSHLLQSLPHANSALGGNGRQLGVIGGKRHARPPTGTLGLAREHCPQAEHISAAARGVHAVEPAQAVHVPRPGTAASRLAGLPSVPRIARRRERTGL